MPSASLSSASRASGRSLPAFGAFLAVGLVAAFGWSVPAAAQPAREVALDLIAPLANDVPVTYFIEHAGSDDASLRADAELCRWALNDWIRHSEGRLSAQAAAENEAIVRVYFDSFAAGRYGEMRPIRVGDRRGAEVYVRTETESLGLGAGIGPESDRLLRETIVYLTCLHEIGHALGMEHTADFDDVMFFFGFGGDIELFFGRYRARLDSRADIEAESGLSDGDLGQLRVAYPSGSSSR